MPDGSMSTFPVPKPLTKEEIQGIVKDYADAAHNAIEAGANPLSACIMLRL